MKSLPPVLWAVLNIHPESAVAGLIIVSVVFAGLIFLIAARGRSVEMKLILLGLVAAVAAVLYGNFSLQDSVGVQLTVPGGGAVGQQVGAALSSGVAAGLMKIAVILVLGGVAVALMARCCPPSPPNTPENAAHGN